MSGHFLANSHFGSSYVNKVWHGSCNRYYIQLCKEVLARLLQRLELRMNIKINKKMRMKIKINNLRARQNENRSQ